MKINHQRQLIEQAFDKYRVMLDEIPDELFDKTPPSGGWSYAEVYSHILQADFNALIAAEKCAIKTAAYTGKKANLLGLLVLGSGSFPSFKVKSPAVSANVKKISKEDARNLIVRVRSRLETVMPLLPGASKNYRIKHPRMGMLNAKQWLRFVRIHTEHHLKQLKRIGKELG